MTTSSRRPRSRGRVPLRTGLALPALVLATSAAGCPCVDSALNASPWLRWKVFAAFGAGRVCEEMTRRGAALRLLDGQPVVGRFFPSQCQSVTNDDRQTLTVQFAGDGYAFTPVTRRLTFSSAATVEYKPDFHKDGDTLYVWFRPVSSQAPSFQLGFVEQPAVGLATAMTPLGTFANLFGQQIAVFELGRGFTVVQDSSGEDFGLGILTPPERPSHPYDTHGSDRYILANDTSDIHYGMLDFIGPFEVTGSGRALYLKFRVSGPAVDVAIVSRTVGDAWRRQYQEGATVPRPGSNPITAGVVQPDLDINQTVAVPQGQYYVVIDNSPYVGQVSPPAPTPLSEAVAHVSYVVSTGDAP